MAALTIATDRKITGGAVRRLRSAISAVPFEGSMLSINAAGYYTPLTAGQPFAGICTRTILLKDAAAANGSTFIDAITGAFLFVGVIAGLTVADIVGRRRVYASSDNDLTLTAEAGNTPIGRLVDLANDYGGIANGVQIAAETFHVDDHDLGLGVGSATLADAAATLTTSQLDLVLYMPNTIARTLTLPPAASCTGRGFTIVKTNAGAAAITLQGNAAELINGANTYATSTSIYAVAQIRSDGTQWIVTGKV